MKYVVVLVGLLFIRHVAFAGGYDRRHTNTHVPCNTNNPGNTNSDTNTNVNEAPPPTNTPPVVETPVVPPPPPPSVVAPEPAPAVEVPQPAPEVVMPAETMQPLPKTMQKPTKLAETGHPLPWFYPLGVAAFIGGMLLLKTKANT